MACTLLSRTLSSRPFPPRWGVSGSRERSGQLQRGPGCERAWAGLEAGQGRGWCRAACWVRDCSQWPWAVSKRRVSPGMIRTHCKVDGVGPQATARAAE